MIQLVSSSQHQTEDGEMKVGWQEDEIRSMGASPGGMVNVFKG